MKKLSEFKFRGYGYCYKCNEYFEDDLPVMGSVFCPNNCGYVVARGLKEIEKDRIEVNNDKQF